MNRFACDLHIHSCLSPCADDDMTPFSIAGMAKLNGLDVAALTDHNACGNCEVFFRACETYGIVPIAGMELTTSEDVHLLCLFRTLADAQAFAARVDERRVRIPNRPSVFGKQILINEDDEPCGQEPDLLINATTLSLEEGAALAREYDGAAVPAHIDREANGLLAVLGGLPEKPDFPAVEVHDARSMESLEREHPALTGKRWIASSDAHRLGDVAEPGCPLELNCDSGADAQTVRNALIDFLLGRCPDERKCV